MSGPPVIDNQGLPQTPAHEWANKTTSAIDSNSITNRDPTIPHFASTGETDPRPPGALPRGADLSAPPTAGDVSQSAQRMMESVKQYLPTQQDIQNAGATAKQYLPESLGAYLPGPNTSSSAPKEVLSDSSTGIGSLSGSNTGSNISGSASHRIPTAQELGQTAKQILPEGYLPGTISSSLSSDKNRNGPSGGVGSLPGTASEVSVAKLPEERRQESLPSHETDFERLGKTSGVGPLPGGPNESGIALLPNEHGKDAPGSKTYHAGTDYSSLPSAEIPSGSRGGIGSLPGAASEAGVAKLPEERLQDSLPSHETDHERLGKTGGVGPLPGGPGESGVALLPEERVNGEGGAVKSNVHGVAATAENKTQKAKEGVQEAKNKATGVLPGHSAQDDSNTDRTAHAQPNSGNRTEGHRANTVSAEGHHKIGFVDKIKGEAMIISGKLGKNEAKVEEGKHKMGK